MKVLLIENERAGDNSFASSLQRKYNVQVAHSGKEGLELAQTKRPNVIVLDAASLRTSGNRICQRLRAQLGALPIIHIRPTDMRNGHSPADVLLYPPFTARKLINRIDRFMEEPSGGELLEVGPFSLNSDLQTLTAFGAEKKLTPKLVTLMEIFIKNLNETLERKAIMQQVWNTDYMGDTRTLDVHIRWLRKAVEPNPRKPQYITTVRGVGYRFVIPEVALTEVPPADAKKAASADKAKKARPKSDADKPAPAASAEAKTSANGSADTTSTTANARPADKKIAADKSAAADD